MKTENIFKVLSVLGLIIGVASAIQIDQGMFIAISDAEMRSHDQEELYKALMFFLGMAISLVWPLSTIKNIFSAARNPRQELIFWKRITTVLASVCIGVFFALGWSIFHAVKVWHIFGLGY